MSFEITSLPLPAKSVSPPSVTEFVKNLRRYKRSSIINTGAALLWASYVARSNAPKFDEHRQILNAYGPKVLMLAMATASEYRSKILTPDGFYALCHDYLGIRDSISIPSVLAQESQEILIHLREAREEDRIPDVYLKSEHIHSAEFFLSRAVRSQHHGHNTNIQELHRAYHIFAQLDKHTLGAATIACRKIFNIEAIHFIRSAFGLFALGNDEGKNGRIHFKGMTFEENVVKKFDIDLDTCRLVASKIAYDENRLRDDWYYKAVLGVPEPYQKYIPTPLSQHPILHRGTEGEYVDFLLPAPALFLRGLINFFFAQLIHENPDLSPKLGEVLEIHIQQALEHIFGSDRVTKIKGSGERADFHITLDSCDLIIEAKARLGSEDAQSLMKPADVAEVWSRLYGACKQCAGSIAQYKKPDRPLVAIVLVADYITVEATPFQSFAERSGLFRDLNINYIEFLSWNSLERSLARTSVKKFEATLLQKWNKKASGMQLADVMSFEMEPDTPAHSYEYLRETEIEIFGKHIPD